MSERDQALINILERLAGEMKQVDLRLEDSLARNTELLKSLESTGRQLRGKQLDADRSHDKLFESFHHYRSDMFKLVNEQDQINRNIDDLQKTLKTTMFLLDNTNQKLADLDERLKMHEKTSYDYYEHTSKQPEIFRDALEDSNRNFTKLHTDTEKHMGRAHRETIRQLEKFQYEAMRRLLLLDNIISSLQTLLVRTEPPERKPSWVARQFNRLISFFRLKLPMLFMRITGRFKK